MSKVSISEAAKLAQISRSTLYNKYINTGKITVETVEDKKVIDMSELLRVFGSQLRKYSSTVQENISQSGVGQAENTVKDKIISLLEAQLQESKVREEWLKSQLEKTTYMLENKQKEEERPKPRKNFLGIF